MRKPKDAANPLEQHYRPHGVGGRAFEVGQLAHPAQATPPPAGDIHALQRELDGMAGNEALPKSFPYQDLQTPAGRELPPVGLTNPEPAPLGGGAFGSRRLGSNIPKEANDAVAAEAGWRLMGPPPYETPLNTTPPPVPGLLSASKPGNRGAALPSEPLMNRDELVSYGAPARGLPPAARSWQLPVTPVHTLEAAPLLEQYAQMNTPIQRKGGTGG